MGELQKVAVAHDAVRASGAECPRGDLRRTHLPLCRHHELAPLLGLDIVHQPEVVQRIILAPVAEAHTRAVLYGALQLLWSEKEAHGPSHCAWCVRTRAQCQQQQAQRTLCFEGGGVDKMDRGGWVVSRITQQEGRGPFFS